MQNVQKKKLTIFYGKRLSELEIMKNSVIVSKMLIYFFCKPFPMPNLFFLFKTIKRCRMFEKHSFVKSSLMTRVSVRFEKCVFLNLKDREKIVGDNLVKKAITESFSSKKNERDPSAPHSFEDTIKAQNAERSTLQALWVPFRTLVRCCL